MSKTLQHSLTALTAVAALTVAQNASAETLFVDFRDADSTGETNADNDQWTSTQGGVEITVTAGPDGDDNELYWDSTDGFGVEGSGFWNYEDDEIEGTEQLVVSFDEEVMVLTVQVSDLFLEGYGDNYTEHGWYSTDGGATTVSFTAQASGGNGEVTVNVNQQTAELLFGAPGREGWHNGSEFSVVGVTIDTGAVNVPELSASGAAAATALLLGFGLLFADRRRGTPAVRFS